MDPYQFHYHIRWSRLATLGYEAFNTRAAAEAGAEQSVLQGETYTIDGTRQNMLTMRVCEEAEILAWHC